MLCYMSQKSDLQGDPFVAVDRVSTDIFDRLSGLQHSDDAAVVQVEDVKSRLQRLGEFLLEATQKPATDTVPDAPIKQPDFEFAVVVESEQPGAFFTLSKAHGGPASKTAPSPLLQDQEDSVSFRAARQRANLPDGIELLEGNSTHYNEDDVMSAIKVVMVEQKREFSRKTLPELEPAPPTQIIDASGDGVQPQTTSQDWRNKLRARVIRFYRQDTILAVSLTVWSILLGMMLINPERVLPVFLTSVYFGVVVLLIFKPGKVVETVSRYWRRFTRAGAEGQS